MKAVSADIPSTSRNPKLRDLAVEAAEREKQAHAAEERVRRAKTRFKAARKRVKEAKAELKDAKKTMKKTFKKAERASKALRKAGGTELAARKSVSRTKRPVGELSNDGH
jgi:predicted  nucleic acid-binding Zn-ribbon protein